MHRRQLTFALLVACGEAVPLIAVMGGPIILLIAWLDLSLTAAAVAGIVPAAGTFCIAYTLALKPEGSHARNF